MVIIYPSSVCTILNMINGRFLSAINPQERVEDPDLLQNNNFNHNKNNVRFNKVLSLKLQLFILYFPFTANWRGSIDSVSLSCGVRHPRLCQELPRYLIFNRKQTRNYGPFNERYMGTCTQAFGVTWFRSPTKAISRRPLK